VYIGGVEISNTPGERWRTFAVPLPPGRLLPDQPAAVLSPTEIKSAVTDSVNIALNGVLVPSSDPSRYIVARADLRRNLFRIPLH
jgi:hypothetical protein